ncbi:MAG: hypothetical protein F4Y38_10185, partial [Gemmatimonadetes bacterium]|nr:hypothetical protein [Gemmatimonadota bacterium]
TPPPPPPPPAPRRPPPPRPAGPGGGGGGGGRPPPRDRVLEYVDDKPHDVRRSEFGQGEQERQEDHQREFGLEGHGVSGDPPHHREPVGTCRTDPVRLGQESSAPVAPGLVHLPLHVDRVILDELVDTPGDPRELGALGRGVADDLDLFVPDHHVDPARADQFFHGGALGIGQLDGRVPVSHACPVRIEP